MTARRWVASFDSATAMARALGAFLRGKDFPALGVVPRFAVPLVERVLASAASRLPSSLLDELYTRAGGREAIAPRELARVDAEEISRWIVSHYPRRRFTAVAVGSSNGALLHLWAALGVPWLPQTVLIPVRRRGVDPDDGRRELEEARGLGEALLERNPELSLHHMHDPNQDRLMVGRMSYFRVKRLVLGETYERFIEERLEPGGTIFVPDCELAWPSVLVSPRYFFQLGAPGGATADEYVRGSARVAAFLARQGSRRRSFDFPTPDFQSREAEWGLDPELLEDVLRFARGRGHRVRRIAFSHPEDPSAFVADLHRWWYRARALRPSRLLVESFILLEPYWCLATGSVPFWTVFGVEPSVESVLRYLDASEPFDEVNAFVFQHGIESVGYAPIESWFRVLERGRRGGRLLGVDARRHPRDFSTFLRYRRALAAIPARYPLPDPLTLRELDAFLASRPGDGRLVWSEETTRRSAAA